MESPPNRPNSSFLILIPVTGITVAGAGRRSWGLLCPNDNGWHPVGLAANDRLMSVLVVGIGVTYEADIHAWFPGAGGEKGG